MDRFANYLVSLSLVLFLIALLLPNHYYPWANFNQELISWVALFFGATAIMVICRGVMFSTYSATLIILISLIPLLQYLTGVVFYFGDAFLAFSYLVGFAIAVLVGFNWQLQYNNNRLINPADALLGYLLISAMLSAGIAIYQWLDLDGLGYLIVDIGPGETPGGNLAQRNNLGSLLCMGLVAAFYFKHTKIISTPTLLLLSAFLVLGLAICQSRTPWLVALLSFGWVFSQRRKLQGSLHIIYALLGLAVFYLFLTVFLLPEAAGWLLLSHDSYLRSAEIGGRSVLWSSLFSSIFVGDWYGYGWSQIGLAQLEIGEKFSNSIFTEYSHNLFLDILLWNGPVIGLVIIGLIMFWAYRQVLVCRTKKQVYLLWIIGCLAVHSMLEYPLAYAYFLAPIGIIIGVVEAASNRGICIKRARLVGFPLLLVLLSALIVIFKDYQIAEAKHRKIRFEAAGIVGSEKMYMPPGNIVVLTQLSSFLQFMETQAKENMTAYELGSMQKIVSRYAYPPSLFRYALALGLNHRHEESRRILEVLQNHNSEGIYAEAVDNWRLMAERYPQLAKVNPPPVDYLRLEKELANKPHR